MLLVYLVLIAVYADKVLCQLSVSGNVTVITNQTENLTTNDTVQHRLELGEFKPSPPLETYYERNAFPVVPAQSEPKNFERSPWKTPNWGHTTPASFTKTPDNPYKYVTNGESRGGFAFDKKVERPMQKTYYDYNIMEKPPGYGEEEVYHPSGYGAHYDLAPAPPPLLPHKGYGHGGYEVGGHYKAPWKKILKFLAAIIPIGLFLSALTPTVITIQNNNDSMMSYRSEDASKEFTKRLSSSYKYFSKLNEDGCEDKVLCELLVSASLSKNAEEHITTLLDNFVKQEDIKSKKDDLLKVFDAVKNQDCSPIYCPNLQNKKDKI